MFQVKMKEKSKHNSKRDLNKMVKEKKARSQKSPNFKHLQVRGLVWQMQSQSSQLLTQILSYTKP